MLKVPLQFQDSICKGPAMNGNGLQLNSEPEPVVEVDHVQSMFFLDNVSEEIVRLVQESTPLNAKQEALLQQRISKFLSSVL